MANQQTINDLKQRVSKVLSSKHVSEVEVGFEYSAGGVRYYTAISRKGFERHCYTVRFNEDADGDRYGKCNCAAGAKDMVCRHILKAAELDTRLFGGTLCEETVAGYRAHLQYEKAA